MLSKCNLDRYATDAQIRKTFQRSLKKQGMNFKMNKKVVGAKKTATGIVLTVVGVYTWTLVSPRLRQ